MPVSKAPAVAYIMFRQKRWAAHAATAAGDFYFKK